MLGGAALVSWWRRTPPAPLRPSPRPPPIVDEPAHPRSRGAPHSFSVGSEHAMCHGSDPRTRGRCASPAVNAGHAPTAKRSSTPGAARTGPVEDRWAWMRDRDDPATIAYLEAENAYATAWFAPHSTSSRTCSGEIRCPAPRRTPTRACRCARTLVVREPHRRRSRLRHPLPRRQHRHQRGTTCCWTRTSRPPPAVTTATTTATATVRRDGDDENYFALRPRST